MIEHTPISFMLHIDGQPTSVHDLLDQAKCAAAEHIAAKRQIHIVSYAAPAPSEAWYYDYDVGAWVHQPNALCLDRR